MSAMRRAGRGAADAGVVLLIFCTLATPAISFLAGRVFAIDGFFHWDHFVMAPALAWRHGMALGVEAYSEYGVGWPLVLNGLSSFVPFSHQSALQLGIFYGCVVHAGLYLLLVALSGSRMLAIAGTALALFLGPFAPSVARQGAPTLWMWPSLTVLRSPMDVWFFMAVSFHARNRRARSAILAGALVGLALLLETDTGLFLAIVFIVYGLCLVLAERFAVLAERAPLPRGSRRPGLVFAGAFAAGVSVLLAGWAVASHGALFTRPGAFAAGWITGMTNTTGIGVGALPFSWFLQHHGTELGWPLAAVGACLLAVAWTMTRLVHGRLDAKSLIAGCVGLYGVAHWTVFVWRTSPLRLASSAIPLAILAVMAVGAARRPRADPSDPRTSRSGHRPVAGDVIGRTLPALALAASLLLLVSSPSFQAYPNLWRMLRAGLPPAGIALFPGRGEIGGLGPERRTQVRTLRAVIRDVERRTRRGERVAVVDPHKTLIFVAADALPWRSSPSWFANTWTLADADRLARSLGPSGPDAVFIRSRAPSRVGSDVWRTLHDAVAAHYAQSQPIGVFEVWERRR